MSRNVAATLRGFIDSTDRSIPAKAFRAAGLVVSIPYSLAARVHHGLYNRGIRRSASVPSPVVSVGNITMGGVGKSPLVAWITDYFISCGKTPGLVSRGYKAKEQAARGDGRPSESRENANPASAEEFAPYTLRNDEAKEFAVRFPDVPYFLGHNRVEVARALLTANPDVDVIILDDAFQHRKISRDLDVVVLDALNPFGGGHVAPSGFLREPVSALSRADVVLLNRADLIDDARRNQIRKRVDAYAPNAVWGEMAQRPHAVCQYEHAADAPDQLTIASTPIVEWLQTHASKRVLAFCGLGAPDGFRKTLKKEGVNVVSFVEFPDHCVYDASDIARLRNAANETNADLILGTMKDFVKFQGTEPLNRPLCALQIGVEFLAGEEFFCQALRQSVESRNKRLP